MVEIKQTLKMKERLQKRPERGALGGTEGKDTL